MPRIIVAFFVCLILSFGYGCDVIPPEGTIIYDIEFPPADSCEAQGNCGGVGGGGVPPGGPVTPTNPNGSGASYTVSKTITNVYEDQSSGDSFTIVLGKAPTANVYMSIANPDTTEVSVAPTSVVFGTGNWSTAQTINLTGVEDGIADGNLSTSLTVSIDNSTDADYNTGIPNATVLVNSIDSSSISSLSIASTGGTNSVTESSGVTDNFTVALGTSPAQDVTISFTSADTGEVTVSPASLTFGSGNYSTPQTVILTAVEDNIADGDQTINVSANSTSTDISYNALSQNISVTVVDSGNAPPAAITNLAASAGTQLNTLTWTKPTGTTSYTLYWSTSSPVSKTSSSFTISSGDTVTYTHAGLTAGTQYYYAIVANNSFGSSSLSNEVSGTPTNYTSPSICNSTGNLTDNDPNLILHYGFNNNLEDNKDTYGDSRYDLSNPNGTIKYAQSCAYGQAAYFDSTTGHLQNTGFDDSSNSNLFVSGNFTLAMWFLADADIEQYTSLMSSKSIPATGSPTDGGQWSFQLDDDGNNKLRWRSAKGRKDESSSNAANYITHTVAANAFTKNQWHYATFVKQDNGTSRIYMDGVLQATSTAEQYSPINSLRIGVNRTGGKIWKGYIDEFKVYNKAFDDDDVTNACLLYSQCSTIAPVTPDNLTATAASTSQINLAWNPVNGVTNYTIEWGTSSGSYTGGTINVAGTTYSHTGRSAATAYYYRIKANNSAGSSAYSSEATATTPAAAGFTISSTTATVRESGVRGDMLWTRVLSNFPTGSSSSSIAHHFDRNVIDSEMNVISTGKTQRSMIATNLGYYDAMIMKHGPSGELIWQKQFGSSYNDDIVDVAVDSSDNIYVFGFTAVANGGDFDGVTISKSGSATYGMLWLLIKFNKHGVRQWITQIDKTGSSSSVGHPRAMDIEGSTIYVAGYSAADSVNQVEKYNLNGVKQGSTINLTPPTGASSTPFVNDLDATSSGVYVATSRIGTSPVRKGKITKLDNNLTSETWQVQHSGNYEYYAVKAMPNGNIVAHARAPWDDGDPRTISIYNSSGSLVTSGAFNQGNTNRVNIVGSDNPSNLAVDSTNNILMIQWDYGDRNQNYLVKYNSSGNFVNEKKLPPNFMSYAVDIRQNSAGEEYIYLTGMDNSQSHSHSYGEISYQYLPTYVGRISNNSVAPVSSTPGYAAITIGVTPVGGTGPAIYVCPKYNNAYITTGIVSDELAIHPAGPITQTYPTNSNPFYSNSCLRLLRTASNTSYATQQLELYAIQDNVTDANQDITLSFEVITTDTTYQSKTIPNVTVTVENASVSVPTAPVNLEATANGSSQIDLTWQKPYMTGLGEGVQNYSLFWSTDNVSFTQITGITNDNYTHSGLNPSTTYYYRVVPNNQAGAGPASNLATATTASARTVTLSGGGGTVAEGDSNSQSVTLTATISATSTQATTVTLSANTTPADAGSVSGTANVDKDWTFGSSTITIPAGSLTGTTTIVIYGDNVDENDEKAYVVVSGVSGGEGAIENGNQTAEVTITDDDTVKLKWSVVGNDTSVDEQGVELTSTTLVLDSQPNGNVVVDAVLSDSTEAVLHLGAQHTFTPSTWFNGKTISLRGVDDDIDDGDVTSQLTISINTSATTDTTGYASLPSKSKTITTRDNDTAGFTVVETGGTTAVSETGSTDNFTIVLNTEPTGDVVFALTDNDTDNTEISYSPTALTFTSSNWDSPQTVTVTGVDDSDVDGTITSSITAAINTGSTADSVYDGLSSQSVTVTTGDNDVARTVTLSRSPTSVTEGDSGSQTITITATLSATSTQATTVNLSSSGVPADAASGSGTSGYDRDWAWGSGTITISAGALTGTTTIVVYGDEVDEDTENVYINLASVSGGQGAVESGTQTANVTINDDDTVAYRFQHAGSVSDNTTVTESGTVGSVTNTDVMNVRLQTRPATGNVVINAISQDLTEFTVSPETLTFTKDNWGTNQQFTVTGVADGITDGDQDPNLRLRVYTPDTADTKWHSLPDKFKTVDVIDVVTLAVPSITAVNAAEQQNQIVWNAYTGATGYKLYYDTNPSVSTSDPYFTIGSSMNAYYHNGLQSGQRVYYRVVATTGSGDSPLSNEMSGLPTSFPGCTDSYVVDNDPNLIVHYPFEGNFEDVKDINTDNRYDMTAVTSSGQAMKFAGSCAGGQSLYIDSTTGQLLNTQFTDTNVGGQLESDNFTISFWVVKDGDMVKFSSAINTGLKASHAPTGDWSNKTQFDVGTGGNMRWVGASGTIGSSGGMVQNQWYHVAGTLEGTAGKLYIDGAYAAQDTTADLGFKALMIGVNRSNDVNTRHWKGYVDELKIYHGAKSQQEIAQDCWDESSTCSYVPITPTNLTGTAGAEHIVLTWDHGVAVDNYTIRWNTTGGAFSGSPSVSDSDNEITVSGNSTTFYHTNLTGGNYYHYKIRANNRNGSSSYSSVLGNQQPLNFVAKTIDTIASGGVCKIQTDRTIKCVGRNNYDQITSGGGSKSTPTLVPSSSNAVALGGAANTTAWMRSDGAYRARGDDPGYGTHSTSISNVSSPIQVAHGDGFVLFLNGDGTITSLGAGFFGKLGNGSTTNQTSTGQTVTGINNAIKVAAGTHHACALLSNGQVWCWGANPQGQLGDNSNTQRNTPVKVNLPSNNAIDIYLGSQNSAAVLANGQVWLWGNNSSGQVTCNTSTANKNSPNMVGSVSTAKKVVIGGTQSVILLEDGTLRICGENNQNFNNLGNAAFQAANSGWTKTPGALTVDGITNAVDIDSNAATTYVLLDNGTVQCFGQNSWDSCPGSGHATTLRTIDGL